MIRPLDLEEIKKLYNERIVNDFPKSEVKPLKKIIAGWENEVYSAYGFYDEDGEELKGYSFFIRCSSDNTVLLDYFAIMPQLRSKGVGTAFLTEIKELASKKEKVLILEVENPKYEEDGPNRDYMVKRITFYKKNGINVSGVECRFYENEYIILYAGEPMEDDEVRERTEKVYVDFFGEKIKEKCEFH